MEVPLALIVLAALLTMNTQEPFFGQFGEVEWVVKNLPLPGCGYFVEVGACDGVELSNTCYFERTMGWKGLLVEPDPRSVSKILRQRTCLLDTRAAGRRAGTASFGLHSDPAWSGIDRPVPGGTRLDVVVASLTQILLDHSAPPVIDLLSIDTEGTELDVWAGLDKSLFRPTIVIVEFDTAELKRDPAGVAAAFEADGYVLRHTTRINHIFTYAHGPAG